jgi:hypothetical protein
VSVGGTRLSEAGRRILKTAAKELQSEKTRLDDVLALRELVSETGPAALDAFDRALAGSRFGGELLERVNPFADAATQAKLLEAAEVFGVGPAYQTMLLEAQRKAKQAPPEQKAPDRVYEASPKHHAGAVAGEFISPAPANGQAALDVSEQVKPMSTRRVSADVKAQQFVVFDETTPGVFHGHTRTWDQLNPEMRAALIRVGFATTTGKLTGGAQ